MLCKGLVAMQEVMSRSYLLRAVTVHQWWGDSESHGDITAIEGRCGAPVHACNNADELCELFHVLGLAPCRKHVVGQMIDVVLYLVVGIKKCLYMPPGDMIFYLHSINPQ